MLVRYHLMPTLNPIRSGDGRPRSSNGAVGDRTRIFLRPVGSPLPLGLLALMCAGLLLSLEQLDAFPLSDQRTVALVMLGFVLPLELLAATVCYLARDTVAGTALGIFGG